MINRFYKNGQKLDVAGLNEITVLLDRSETEFSEVGWNCWRPKLDGPPHRHNDKDQIFYITDGVGQVKLDKKAFDVKPGCLVYVPAGTVHQTITTGDQSLCYILFNVFSSQSKEGHATFADHIEKVKQIRKQQAESGNVTVDNEEVLPDIKAHKFFSDVHNGKLYEFGSNTTTLLLERNETNRVEFALIKWREGKRGAMVAHKDKEQVFFVVAGEGAITVDGVTEMVKPGHLIFVPRNTPHTTEAKNGELTYLCMNSLSESAGDKSFDSMYRRIIGGRMKRFDSGDNSVGE